jgi:hypothetical protein
MWLLFPFALIFGAIVSQRAAGPNASFNFGIAWSGWLGLVLLAYAVFMFIWFYRFTGGASSVSVVHGQYVYMYKSKVIRSITEQEYMMFPNRVVRVMSAWMGAMSVIGKAG